MRLFGLILIILGILTSVSFINIKLFLVMISINSILLLSAPAIFHLSQITDDLSFLNPKLKKELTVEILREREKRFAEYLCKGKREVRES